MNVVEAPQGWESGPISHAWTCGDHMKMWLLRDHGAVRYIATIRGAETEGGCYRLPSRALERVRSDERKGLPTTTAGRASIMRVIANSIRDSLFREQQAPLQWLGAQEARPTDARRWT